MNYDSFLRFIFLSSFWGCLELFYFNDFSDRVEFHFYDLLVFLRNIMIWVGLLSHGVGYIRFLLTRRQKAGNYYCYD